MNEVIPSVVDFKRRLIAQALALIDDYADYTRGGWVRDCARLSPRNRAVAAAEMAYAAKRLISVMTYFGLPPRLAVEVRGLLRDMPMSECPEILERELPKVAELARVSADLHRRIRRIYGHAMREITVPDQGIANHQGRAPRRI